MPVKIFIAVTLLSVALIGCGQDDRNLTETSTPAPLFSDEAVSYTHLTLPTKRIV